MSPSHASNTLILQLTSYTLCFIAASISGAGGVGGGSLYLPILHLVSGMNLKSAAAISSSMVTSGSVASVIFNLRSNSRSLIDYEIALLSQPSMLFGVGVGVVCNVMFPEWLITVLFAVFLGCSTCKICGAGFRCWKEESDDRGMKERLLEGREGGGVAWRSMVVLLVIWVTFFMLHLLVGRKDGQVIQYL